MRRFPFSAGPLLDKAGLPCLAPCRRVLAATQVWRRPGVEASWESRLVVGRYRDHRPGAGGTSHSALWRAKHGLCLPGIWIRAHAALPVRKEVET